MSAKRPAPLPVALFALVFLAVAAAQTSPLLDVPFVRQSRAACGSAAVAMVMQYWARQRPDLDSAAAAADRALEALPPSESGVAGEALKDYLQRHGFDAFVFTADLDDLRGHLAKGRPLLVCFDDAGRGRPLHYAVVVGIDDRRILLNDPARGKLVHQALDDFKTAWAASDNWALLAVPRRNS